MKKNKEEKVEEVKEVEKIEEADKVEEVEKEEKKEKKEKKEKADKKEKEAKKEEAKKTTELNKVDEKKIKKISKVSSDKIAVFSVIAIVLLIAFGLFFYLYYSQNMVAVVTFDGGKVTRAEYEVYYKTFQPFLTSYYGYSEDEVGTQIAEKAALDKIIVKDATAAGVTLSEEDIAAIDEVFNDEDRVKSFTDSGIDIGIMRQLYESDYMITNYMEKLAEDLTDEEIKTYITDTYGETADLYEYDTRHILFKTIDDSYYPLSDSEKAEKKAKAEEVLKRALAGEDFATLAKEFSEDTTAENGGEFIMYMDGNTVTEYSDAVAKLSEGQITSALVESDYGYHIIKLEKKVENGRLQNSTEREACVSAKINNLTEERNVKVNEDVMNKIIEKLNSTSASTSSDDEDEDEYDVDVDAVEVEEDAEAVEE